MEGARRASRVAAANSTLSGVDPNDELAAQYVLARSDNPGASVEEIVAMVGDRMSADGETTVAAENVSAGGDVDVIRRFVDQMEREAESESRTSSALRAVTGCRQG
jgi:hypothetical protein